MSSDEPIQRLPPLPVYACARCGCTQWRQATYKPVPGDAAHVIAHLRCAHCGAHATQLRPAPRTRVAWVYKG